MPGKSIYDWRDEEQKKIEEQQRQSLDGYNKLKVVTPPTVTDLDYTQNPDYVTASKYLQDFTDTYTPKDMVLTPTEIEKRKRAAAMAEGIGALGNAASAISNLIFAGKGAPSQTLPKNIDATAAIKDLEERERVKRNEIYQRAKERVAATKADAEAKAKAKQQAYANENSALDQQMRINAEGRNVALFPYQMRNAVNQMVVGHNQADASQYAPEASRLANKAAEYSNSLKALQVQEQAANAPYFKQNAQNKAEALRTTKRLTYAMKDSEGNVSRVPLEISEKVWNSPENLGVLANALGIPTSKSVVIGGYNGLGGTTKTEAKTLQELQIEIGEKLNDPSNTGKVIQILETLGAGSAVIKD